MNALEFINTIFQSVLTKFIVAIVIVLLGFIIGRIFGKLTEKILHEIELNHFIKNVFKVKVSLEELLGHLVMYVIYFFAIVQALNQIGVTDTVVNLLSFMVIALIAVSIFLGIKDYIPNAMAGLIIHQRGFIHEGAYVKVMGIEGKVIKTTLVETIIETPKKDLIYIPNSLLTKNKVEKKR